MERHRTLAEALDNFNRAWENLTSVINEKIREMRFLKGLFDKSNDPVCNCKLYLKDGCSHVDGHLCDFPNCSMQKEYELRELEQELDTPHKDRIK